MSKLLVFLVVTTPVFFLSYQSARADVIGFATSFENSELYSVNFSESTATLIGATGFTNVSGLAFQPGTGVLYGVDHASDQLITINTSTGAGTAVGFLGVDVFDVGLAFDGSGNLFMSADGGGESLYSIDPSTGITTEIGTISSSGVAGLDFSPSGVLYGLADTPDNNLVVIDPLTGDTTIVGGLGFSTNTGGIGFFDDSDTIYAAFGFANEGLTTIDAASGAAATPVDVGIDFAGLAVVTIPEPTSAVFICGLSGCLLASRRR